MKTNFNKGQEYLLKLSLALYRVTERFPHRDPLRLLTRKKALEVLKNLTLVSAEKNPGLLSLNQKKRRALYQEVIADIEVLKQYLRIAQAQSWVKKENCAVLLREYQVLQNKVLRSKTARAEAPDSLKAGGRVRFKEARKRSQDQGKVNLAHLDNERQKKIIRILGQSSQAQLGQIKEFFPQVTKRTLRRDLNKLLDMGLVQRKGDGKFTFYRLRPNVRLE